MLREGCRASSHPVRLKESSGVSSLPEKRVRVTLESIAVPLLTGALPSSTANTVFLSPKKPIVTAVRSASVAFITTVCANKVAIDRKRGNMVAMDTHGLVVVVIGAYTVRTV